MASFVTRGVLCLFKCDFPASGVTVFHISTGGIMLDRKYRCIQKRQLIREIQLRYLSDKHNVLVDNTEYINDCCVVYNSSGKGPQT